MSARNHTFLDERMLSLEDLVAVAVRVLSSSEPLVTIGDAGYPLCPLLLTPYQLEDDLSDLDRKNEFNRRHCEATTVVVLRVLARLKDMWKCLRGEGWHPNNQRDKWLTIGTCFLLHNIVIDMEEEDADKHRGQEEINCIKQVRQIADNDALRSTQWLKRRNRK